MIVSSTAHENKSARQERISGGGQLWEDVAFESIAFFNKSQYDSKLGQFLHILPTTSLYKSPYIVRLLPESQGGI